MYSFVREKKRKLLNKTKKMRFKKQMKREKNIKKTKRQKMNRTIRSKTRSKTRSKVYRNTSKKIKGGASNVGHYVGKPNNNPYLGYGEYQ